jgi:hypothetical protein
MIQVILPVVFQRVFNPASQLSLLLLLLPVVFQRVFNPASQLSLLLLLLPVVILLRAAEPPVIARKVAAEENPKRIISPKEEGTVNKSPNYYSFNKSIIIYIISFKTRHPLL